MVKTPDKSKPPPDEIGSNNAPKSPNFIGACYDWIDSSIIGAEASQRHNEKGIKLMLTLESKIHIASMRLFLSGNTPRGDSFFDQERKIVIRKIENASNYPTFKDQGLEKQTEIQRYLFARYIEGLLKMARGNKQSDASIKGIAWSLLATDAKKALRERGQSINKDWLFNKIGPLIRANNEPNAIKQELAKFSQADPEVIST